MGGQGRQFVGPEWPAFKDYYDLGNFQPYSYNVTLAKQYLAAANIQNMPPLIIRTISGCGYCATSAEIVQYYLTKLEFQRMFSSWKRRSTSRRTEVFKQWSRILPNLGTYLSLMAIATQTRDLPHTITGAY